MVATIHNYASVVLLDWQPKNSVQSWRKNKDIRISVTYILKVKKASTGELINVIAANYWAEKNFSPKALPAAQKAYVNYGEVSVRLVPKKKQKMRLVLLM